MGWSGGPLPLRSLTSRGCPDLSIRGGGGREEETERRLSARLTSGVMGYNSGPLASLLKWRQLRHWRKGEM